MTSAFSLTMIAFLEQREAATTPEAKRAIEEQMAEEIKLAHRGRRPEPRDHAKAAAGDKE